MIKINLNTVKQVLSEYNVPKSELNAFTKVVRAQILSEFTQNLTRLAKTKLHSTRTIYLQGIRIKPNSVDLVGFLPNAVENGLSPFDMKADFAKSKKAKKSKNGGWYLTIPFRFGTPNSSGVNFPIIPRDIYNAIRNAKKPNLDNYPPKTRQAVTDPASGKVWEAYEHKFSIYEGITITNINPETNRSTYHTFRRVSSNSDPNSWIHTGIKAHNLFDEAWRETDVDSILNDAINSLI